MEIHTRDELKEMCRRKSLKISGTKKELTDRIYPLIKEDWENGEDEDGGEGCGLLCTSDLSDSEDESEYEVEDDEVDDDEDWGEEGVDWEWVWYYE